ncbi:MAG: DinB family protein [Raineya sp.]|nr:DinB family protein [Raineya sp.]
MSLNQKPLVGEYPPYAEMYLQHVNNENILVLLQERIETVKQIYNQIDEQKANFRYAPEKWSIKEVLLHVVDTERIFAYRAISIARGDTRALMGFDQDVFVQHSYADERTLSSIVEEFELVRNSNISLFKNLNSNVLTTKGNANGYDVTPRAIAFMLAGHEIHHTKIILERYLA